MKRREFVVVSTGSLLITATGVVEGQEPSYQFDGSVVFQGQPVTVSGDAIEPETSYELRRVDAFYTGQVNDSSFVSTVQSDANGEMSIQTDDLDASNYFIRGNNLPSQPDRSDTFEVALQDLDPRFLHKNVEQGLGTQLDIDSNRGQYTVEISASGLSTSDLTSIFIDQGGFELAAEQPDGSKIRLKESQDRTRPAIFSRNIGTGEYTFNFDVIDTTATATTAITVEEADRDTRLSITPSDTTVVEGDEKKFSVTLFGASDGLGSYSFDIELDDGSFANISEISLIGADPSNDGVEISIAGSTASISVEQPSFSRLQESEILHFDVAAESLNRIASFDITLNDVNINTDSAESYTVTTDSTSVLIETAGGGRTDATGIVWQGETAVKDAEHISVNEDYELRQVLSGMVDDSAFVREIAATEVGEIEVETADLDAGQYFFRGGDFVTNPNSEDIFEIVIQSLSVEFEDSSIDAEGKAELIIESNRASYNLIVACDSQLTQDELIDVFVTKGTFELEDEFLGADNQIIISVPESGAGNISFDSIKSGDYTFTFQPPVVQATASAEVMVGGNNEENSFYEVEITDPENDSTVASDQALAVVASISNTGQSSDTQTITLTSPISSFSDELTLEPNTSGNAEFVIPEENISDEITITVESGDTSDTVTVAANDCFIATASYGTATAEEIDVLRDFRDDVLKSTWTGEQCVRIYYRTSPPIADWIRKKEHRQDVVREYFVEPIVKFVNRLGS